MDFRGILFYLIAHSAIAELPLVIHNLKAEIFSLLILPSVMLAIQRVKKSAGLREVFQQSSHPAVK